MTTGPTTPPPPRTGMAWPSREVLATTGVVLARPRMDDAAATAAMQRDPRLWVGVPPSSRVTSTGRQEDDFRHFLAHWRAHGFGYWLVWEDGTGPDRARATASGGGGGPIGLGGLRWMWWDHHWVLNTYVRVAVTAQGRGLASSLLQRAMDRLGAHLDEPTTVVVRTRPENTPMVHLAGRMGFDDVGTEEREVGTYRVLTTRIGGGSSPVPQRAEVRLRPGGPMVVSGSVPVRTGPWPDGAGSWPDEDTLVACSDPDGRGDQALCRCGRTATPPHCDRSHRDRPTTTGGPAGADRPDPPAIGIGPPAPGGGRGVVVVDGGPLVVHGVPVESSDGVRAVGPVAVCRCDGTDTRPWCDGRGCGFVAR